MQNKLRQWLDAATLAEREKLVKHAKTTLGTLRQQAGGYRNAGRASLSVELARNIELSAARVHRDGLPVLKRTDLCAGCGKCEFAKGK